MIDEKLIKGKNLVKLSGDELIFSTLTGNGSVLGLAKLSLTIGQITKFVIVYATELVGVDLLLGLDNIYKFNLRCESDYSVYQNQFVILPSHVKIIKPANEISDNFFVDLVSKLTDCSQNKLLDILKSNETVFSDNKFDIGCLHDIECSIELETKIPVYSKAYHTSMENQKRIDAEVDSLLKANLIRYSSSPYASPVTLAFKKEDGEKTRFCIDYRKLNEKVITDKYPMPLIRDIIDNLYDKKYFTVLDIRSGFWHVKVRDSDIAKTAFITQNDHYEWLVMPFGYKNAPAIFQRAIKQLLERNRLTQFSHNYIADIIIYSENY